MSAIETLDIAPVWSGHPVGFDLVTHGDHQFVAFYDAQRRMTVAWRTVDSRQWSFHVLPSSVGWDSHNYLRLAVDDHQCLHLAGNMHSGPLVYFRTSRPLDPASFQQMPAMLGRNEVRCTYPHFFRGPGRELVYTYRDGQSGAGNQIYNVYDHPSRTWKRLLDQPLTDGRGHMNAYLHGPRQGPDGFFHLCWVWRNAWDAGTNHTLSYARSRDLRHWETGAGRPLMLPLTLENADIVDPVPPHAGIMNGNALLGFDSRQRPIISYHKFDAAGNTQLYNARLEDGRWVIHQTSQWDYRWDISGEGSIHFQIRLRPVVLHADGSLQQTFTHDEYGSASFRLDDNTLAAIEQVPLPPAPAWEHPEPESDFPGMQVRWRPDSTEPSPFLLRWETLAEHQDQPRPEPWPAPSMLRLYRRG